MNRRTFLGTLAASTVATRPAMTDGMFSTVGDAPILHGAERVLTADEVRAMMAALEPAYEPGARWVAEDEPYR